MKTNVRGLDREVRIVLGLGVIGAGVVLKSWWGALGVIFLVTGLVGFCPLYLPLGFSSCPLKSLSGQGEEKPSQSG